MKQIIVYCMAIVYFAVVCIPVAAILYSIVTILFILKKFSK